MDAAGAWLPRALGSVERELQRVAEGLPEPLAAEAEATLEAGGKRLRPLMVLIAAGDEYSERSLAAAVAVELIHMATLVHDDVIDGASVRRGAPTVVARAGRDRAIQVGDALFARAFGELAGVGAVAELGDLAGASVALARGELDQREAAYDTSLSEAAYLERCRLKTASLFEAACAAGARSTRPEAVDALARFGADVGLAFQLLDDVLDVRGPVERTGKARGTDLLDGTVTLPLIVARERDEALAAVDLSGLDQARAAELCDRIEATGALGDVTSRAEEIVEGARAAVAAAPIEAQTRELLDLVAEGMVDRYS